MGTALHAFHVAGVAVAVLVLLVMLLPAVLDSAEHRRADELRRAAAQGRLVDLAVQTVVAARPEPGSGRVPPAARAVTVTGCLGAATVHAAVCPEHFAEATRFGLFFLLLAVAQSTLAVLVARSERARWSAAAAAVAAAAVLLWALTRTVDLPWGLATVEPVGVPDVLASAFELLTVVAGAYAVTAARPPARPLSAAPAR